MCLIAADGEPFTAPAGVGVTDQLSTEATIHPRPGLHRGLGCALPTSGAACYVNDSVVEPSGAGLHSHPQPQGRYFMLSSLIGDARAWSFIHSLICPLIPSLSAGDAPGALGAWQVAAEKASGEEAKPS